MSYTIKYVNGHVEVLDESGHFMFSADTAQEARKELAQQD
jgi:hypothetical protein